MIMNKPIIRHCYNCKWYYRNMKTGDRYNNNDCQVTYRNIITKKKLTALLCRYYCKPERTDNEK